ESCHQRDHSQHDEAGDDQPRQLRTGATGRRSGRVGPDRAARRKVLSWLGILRVGTRLRVRVLTALRVWVRTGLLVRIVTAALRLAAQRRVLPIRIGSVRSLSIGATGRNRHLPTTLTVFE